MAVFTQSKLLNILRFFTVPGRKIFVDTSTGSDSTGDGSEGSPYASLSRGFQDVRDGRNDILIYRDASSSITATATATPVVVSLKNDWTLVGQGTPFIGTATAGGGPFTPVSGYVVNALQAMFVLASGHGMVAGQGTIGVGFTTGASNKGVLGGGVVISTSGVSGVLISFDTGVVSSQAPFVSGAAGIGNGRLYGLPLSLTGCSNVIIAGINFGTSAFADTLGGLAIDGNDVLGNGVSRNVLLAGVLFADSALSYTRMPSGGVDLFQAGKFFKVEQCIFSPGQSSFFKPNARKASSLYLNGTAEMVFNECIFQFSTALVGATFLVPPIHVTRNPGAGILFTENIISDSIPSGQLVFDNTVSGVSRITFSNNVFIGQGMDHVNVLSGGSLFDHERAAYPNNTYVPTLDSLIWGRPVYDAVLDAPGTMGELLGSLLPGQVSGVAAQVSGVSGQIAALPTDCATAAQVSGVASQASGISSQVSGVASQASGISSQVSGVASQASGISSQVSGVAAQVSGVSGQIAALPADCATAAQVSGIASQASGISSQVSGVSSQVSGVSGQIAALPADCATAAQVSGIASQASGISSQVSGVSSQVSGIGSVSGIAELQATLDVVSGDLATVSGEVTQLAIDMGDVYGEIVTNDMRAAIDRLHGGNIRTRLYYAATEVNESQRFVPVSGASHMEVEIKTGANFANTPSYYVWFGYRLGATSGDAPASANIFLTAPTDGLFDTRPFPVSDP